MMRSIWYIVLMVVLSGNAFSASRDTQACEQAVHAIAKYDPVYWQKASKGLDCSFNTRQEKYWACVIDDLKEDGSAIRAMGVCDKKS